MEDYIDLHMFYKNLSIVEFVSNLEKYTDSYILYTHKCTFYCSKGFSSSAIHFSSLMCKGISIVYEQGMLKTFPDPPSLLTELFHLFI